MSLGIAARAATRIAAGLATVLVASFVIYGALFLAPGSAANFLVSGRTTSPEQIAQIKAQYHLNDPFLVQWWRWLSGAAHGDFGRSLVQRNDVWTLVEPRIGSTLLLIVMASLLTVAFGVVSGTVAGLRQGRASDTAVRLVNGVALAVPSFVAGVVLISIFGVWLRWFPTSGAEGDLMARLHGLVLPSIALALSSGAYVSRISRAAVLTEAQSDYVVTAEIGGLSRRSIVLRHILRNALIPITTVTGVTIAGLISSSVVVEAVFGLNGLGALLLQSVLSKDFAVVQAITLMMVAAFIVVNGVVDVVYMMLDPRVANGARS